MTQRTNERAGSMSGARCSKKRRAHRFLQLRLRVGAAWSNLRLILEMDWLGRFDRRQERIVGTQRGPRLNSVPEPVGRAMGGFGLGLRTGQNDRQGLIVVNKYGPR